MASERAVEQASGRGNGPLARRRLLQMLSPLRPLTVVSAPAGYGKSTLLESWAAEHIGDATIVRIALDDEGPLPHAFWPSLTAALREAGVVVRHATAAGGTHDGARGLAKALAADIAEHGRRVVCILDCGESALSAQVGRDVDRLIRITGDSLAMVILTREDPPMPLHRLRLAGSLCELRAQDLAFTAGEVAAWMEREGLVLTPQEVSALRTRTGGWPAALRFATMSLQAQPDVSAAIQAFRGDTGNVAEYLMDEVLQRQPPKRRRFLLRSCIVEELDPPLVEELTGQHCDVQVLEELTASGCFVERIPGQHDRFRFHALFRQFLRAQLWFEKAPEPAVLHQLAAEWLAREGQSLAALRHAVAAADWRLATHVLIDSLAFVDLLSGERSRFLHDMFVGLPPGVDGVEAALTRAAVSLADLDPTTAGVHLEAARASTGRHFPRSQACTVAGAVLESLQTSLVLDTSSALDLALDKALVAEKMVRLLPADTERGAHSHLTTVVAGCTGRVLLARGDFQAASEAVLDGVHAAEAVGLGHAASELKGMSALVEAVTGHLRRATAIVAQLSPAQAVHVDDAPVMSEAARLSLAWVRTDEAEGVLARGLVDQARHEQRSYDSNLLDSVATLLRVRLLTDRGDLGLALAELRAARDSRPGHRPDAEGRFKPGWLGRALLIAQVDALTRLGRPQDAVELVRRADGEDGPRHLDVEISLQGALLAAGDPGRDLTRLTTERVAPRTTTPVAEQMARWLVLAAAALADHDPTAATGHLGWALRLGKADRLRRPILNAPGAVQELLAEGGLADRNRWLRPRDEDADGESAPFVVPEQRRSPRQPAIDAADQGFIPLTKKETEALGYLAKLLTTDEIAAEMFVSVNTVRSHVRSILRKLGVSRRNEAVRRAWELKLLLPDNAA